MKKHGNRHRSIVFITAAAMCLSGPVTAIAAAETVAPPIGIVLDGERVDAPVDPILIEGSVMIPLRALMDAFGVQAYFQEGKIFGRHDGKHYEARVNESQAILDGRKVQLARPPVVRDGRAYVPIRFAALLLGKEVNYDAAARDVIIGLSEASALALQRGLFEAARAGDAKAIEELIRRGADPNGKLLDSYLDNSVLRYAVLNDRTEAVKVLLANGAKLLESEQHNLAWEAILHGNVHMLEILLEAGLDVTKTSSYGWTLLQTASGVIGIGDGQGGSRDQPPNPAIVALLLEFGADPGADDSLTQAVQAQNYNIVQQLLRAGADLYKVDEFGATPYDRLAGSELTSWATIQQARTKTPTLGVADRQGRNLENATIRLVADGLLPRGGRSFPIVDGKAALDVPNGTYRVVSIGTKTGVILLPSGTTIAVQGETVAPSKIEFAASFPEGKLTIDGKTAAGEMISIGSRAELFIGTFELEKGAFDVTLPPGDYRIIDYLDENGDFYTVDRWFTVKEGEGTLTIDIPLTALKPNPPIEK